MPWLRVLVAGLSSRRLKFDPRALRIGFVIDKGALLHVYLQIIRCYPVSMIQPMLQTQICIRLSSTLPNLRNRQRR